MQDKEVDCPKHAGPFNVRTGKALCESVRVSLKTFAVDVRNGVVYVDVPA